MNQLRLLMDEKLYPPRFKAIVQARNKDFFESSNYLYYQLTCGTEVIKGKLVVPGRGMKMIGYFINIHCLFVLFSQIRLYLPQALANQIAP